MPDSDPIQVPLSAADATAQVDELIARLEEADALLLKYKQDAETAFSKATGIGGVPYANLGRALGNQQPSAVSPQFAQAVAAIQARQSTLDQSARIFLASPAAKSVGGSGGSAQGGGGAAPSVDALLAAFRTYAGQSGASAPSATQKPVPITPSPEFGEGHGPRLRQV